MSRRYLARRVEHTCPYCDHVQGYEVDSVHDDDDLVTCLYCRTQYVVQVHVEITISTRELLGGKAESVRKAAQRSPSEPIDRVVS